MSSTMPRRRSSASAVTRAQASTTTAPSSAARACISSLGLARRPLGRRAHVHARAAANLDAAFDVECDQRLAQRGPRHAQLLCQVALGGQAGADIEAAMLDQLADLVGDLLVEPASFDWLELD